MVGMSNSTDPCGAQDCVRASDIGIWLSGDPVAYVHPNCSVHGAPHPFVAGGGKDGAGRQLCAQCRAYADEHPSALKDEPQQIPGSPHTY